ERRTANDHVVLDARRGGDVKHLVRHEQVKTVAVGGDVQALVDGALVLGAECVGGTQGEPKTHDQTRDGVAGTHNSPRIYGKDESTDRPSEWKLFGRDLRHDDAVNLRLMHVTAHAADQVPGFRVLDRGAGLQSDERPQRLDVEHVGVGERLQVA